MHVFPSELVLEMDRCEIEKETHEKTVVGLISEDRIG